MAKNILVDLNLNQNEIQNFIIQNLTVAPTSPKPGQMYFDTVADELKVYDGTTWTNTSKTYTFDDGLTEDENGKVTLDIATDSTIGGVIVGAHLAVTANGTVSVDEASNTQMGVIRIATDAEVETGTATLLAVNPKQLHDGLEPKTEVEDFSVDTTCKDQMEYTSDKTARTGVFKLLVDEEVTEDSKKLITSGGVYDAIAAAKIGVARYQGTWTATDQTDYSSIHLPVEKGYFYLVNGKGTVQGVNWNAGDYLIINKNIKAGETITANDVEKVDNTEAEDIVRLDAVQTLTNKTLDLDNNTITNVELDNFKTGVVQTALRKVEDSQDTSILTELVVATELAKKPEKMIVTNPLLSHAGTACTWVITNTLGNDDVIVTVKEAATGEEVLCDVTYGEGTITIGINSANDIVAGTYKAVIIG